MEEDLIHVPRNIEKQLKKIFAHYQNYWGSEPNEVKVEFSHEFCGSGGVTCGDFEVVLTFSTPMDPIKFTVTCDIDDDA